MQEKVLIPTPDASPLAPPSGPSSSTLGGRDSSRQDACSCITSLPCAAELVLSVGEEAAVRPRFSFIAELLGSHVNSPSLLLFFSCYN